MSEKKYVLERGEDAGYKLTPHPNGHTDYRTVDHTELDLLRINPDVEDRTKPDYSDVPVGTAGTATVRGVEGVRIMRCGYSSGDYWITPLDATDRRVHDDEHVTDFKADVVVDEALIERVMNLMVEWGSGDNERIEVRAILRGEL
jgi:hypothetical protein